MKRLALVLSLLLVSQVAFAITLAWDDDPSWIDAGVAGIRVYWDDDVAGGTKYADVPRPNNMTTIDNLNFKMGTTYHFWATAFNSTEESPPSNVVTSTYSWQGTWGSTPGTPPPLNAPKLRLSETGGGYVIPSGSIKTVP